MLCLLFYVASHLSESILQLPGTHVPVSVQIQGGTDVKVSSQAA